LESPSFFSSSPFTGSGYYAGTGAYYGTDSLLLGSPFTLSNRNKHSSRISNNGFMIISASIMS